MAHHKSALKRIRQTRKSKLFNRLKMKGLKQAVRAVAEAKTYEEGAEKLKTAYRVLDKLSVKGILHKNTASRKKSSIAKAVKKLQAKQI